MVQAAGENICDCSRYLFISFCHFDEISIQINKESLKNVSVVGLQAAGLEKFLDCNFKLIVLSNCLKIYD